jgi:hypothetical protein
LSNKSAFSRPEKKTRFVATMDRVGLVRRSLVYPHTMHAVAEEMLRFLSDGDPRLRGLLGGRPLFRELFGALEWSRLRQDGRVPLLVFWWLQAAPVDVFTRAAREQERGVRGEPEAERDQNEWEEHVRFRMAELRASPYSSDNARQLIDGLRDALATARARPSLRRDRPFAPGALNEQMNRLQEQLHGKDNEPSKVAAWRDDLAQAARLLLNEEQRGSCRLNQAQAEEHADKSVRLLEDWCRKRVATDQAGSGGGGTKRRAVESSHRTATAEEEGT